MAGLIQIAAVCVLCAVLAALLKGSRRELALLLTVGVCCGVLLFALKRFSAVVTVMRQLAGEGGLSKDLLEPMLKTVAISIITRLGTSLCRDAGEEAMASVVEMAGAFGAVVVALPLFGMVWELLRGML